MARALKIYRTAIGFHDAYVAAASQKAALEAWGSEKDLFARGAAEVVAETPFADELIAQPGVVVKKLRGSVAEQMAALPPTPAKKPRKVEPEPAANKPRKPAPKPRPSRAKLDEAERAIAAAERRHEAAMRALAEREAALVRERRTLTKAQREESAALEDARDAERRAFDAALERWAR
ncbi:MAG TPA: hypothetical protein VF638_08660 [Sphingomonas sp.]